ncbi:hypothetical protein Lalb_Chr10g0094021 [Lupinus albus]|uniref:Uncharacterized protein n=1 Tax=Lupinus albus TaxID=3870 RepID=A0A6A4PUK8_LUPAL|nr:hypothetical protein Lalb_Chr10g0094021 [Lupinus albus]
MIFPRMMIVVVLRWVLHGVWGCVDVSGRIGILVLGVCVWVMGLRFRELRGRTVGVLCIFLVLSGYKICLALFFL